MDKYVSQQYTVLKCIVGLLVSEDAARYKQGNRICLIFLSNFHLFYNIDMYVNPPPPSDLESESTFTGNG